MNTPFLAGAMNLEEEPQYGMSTAEFFCDPAVCSLVCGGCSLREFRGKCSFLDVDQMLMALVNYQLLGVEMIQVRGGDPFLLVGNLLPVLSIIQANFRVRVMTSVSRVPVVERLKALVDGFMVDLKVPMREPEVEDRVFSEWALGTSKALEQHQDDLRQVVELVDGMGCTFYGCSNYGRMSVEQRESLVEFAKEKKSPLIVAGEFLTRRPK